MATDYQALKDSVAFYSDREDITATVYDRYFRITCEKLNRVLRPTEAVTSVTLTGVEFPYTDTNSAIMDIDSMYVTRSSTISKLEYLSLPALKRVQAEGGGGIPRYFTTIGKQILLAPEPDAADEVDVYYYARQDDVLGDTETNVFITYYETITLYYMLAEVYKGLHDFERAMEYTGMADALIGEVNLQAWNRKYTNSLTVRNA